MGIIKINNLHFGYQRGQSILQGLNMEVPEGSIYGFLGSNGAGKSTTIRTLLRLLRPNSGDIRLLQHPLASAPPTLFAQVGSLIEAPSLYPQLNAQDHLRLACRYHKIDTQQIEPLLDKVGLLAHRKKKTKHFSTGMKQRMGLAMALVHEPRLLILDEPTNGLDPQGISDIRALILQLQQEGKTILLSSHLLSEIERIATQVGILKNGSMLFEGSITELEQWRTAQLLLEVKTNDPALALSVLKQSFSATVTETGLLHIKIKQKMDIPELVRQLVAAQLDIYELRLQKSDLEKLFMEVTQN